MPAPPGAVPAPRMGGARGSTCVPKGEQVPTNYDLSAIEQDSPPRDAALLYARRGWSVVPVWPHRGGVCTCPLDARCTSAGAHLHERTPTIDSATKDLDEIASWPSDVNVGVALGEANDGLRVLILDEPLSEIGVCLGAGLLVAAARCDGALELHYYQIGAETHPHDEHGSVGELLADGRWVLAPPSPDVSGCRHMWVSNGPWADLEESNGAAN